MASTLACRLLLLSLGCAALAWSVTMLTSGRLNGDLDRIADKILRGENFRTEDLDRLRSRMAEVEADPLARAAALRSAAIITLRQAETAIADGRRTAIDERLDDLGRLLARALATAPTDPYLWLALFWQRNTVAGFDPADLDLLARSYRLGPAEGWVGVRRVRLALPLVARVPPALEEQVLQEFALLVNSGFPEMPGILVGAGWAVREKLLPLLRTVGEERRKSFARSLTAMGYTVDIPGLAVQEDRPWTR